MCHYPPPCPPQPCPPPAPHPCCGPKPVLVYPCVPVPEVTVLCPSNVVFGAPTGVTTATTSLVFSITGTNLSCLTTVAPVIVLSQNGTPVPVVGTITASGSPLVYTATFNGVSGLLAGALRYSITVPPCAGCPCPTFGSGTITVGTPVI